MTAPRITRTGTLRVDAMCADIWDDRLVAAVVALRPEDGDIRSLDGQRVRITIEPETPHAPGDALDYLAELKSLMQGALDGYAISEQTERALRRGLGLANTASNAILAERRAAR